MSATDTIKKDIHRTNWGSIERLNITNYIDWKMNVKSILNSMRAWEIITGEEKELTEIPPTLANLELAIESFKQRKNDTVTLLRSCINSTTQNSSVVWRIQPKCMSPSGTSSTDSIPKCIAPSTWTICTPSNLTQVNVSATTANDCFTTAILSMEPMKRYWIPSFSSTSSIM